MDNSISINRTPQFLTKSILWVMAIGSGLSVANLYYNQPLLADMAQTFHVSARQMGSVSMFTQIGYALGLFVFVPLGDMKERRRLITILLCAVTLSLLGVAISQNITMLEITSFLVGATTVVPQLIVPFAVQLANPGEQGKVVGLVMSGLFFGILLARTVSGLIGNIFGWRTMYYIAATLMLILAFVLRYKLPKGEPVSSSVTYLQLFHSLWKLIAKLPVLREASIMGGMLFGAFSAFWTTLAFYIKQPPYHYGAQVAGLFGLVGVVGASIAPVAGRLADKKSPRLVAGIATFITLLSFITFWGLGNKIWGLIIGVILLDLGVQGAQISNQARIYILIPEARNRINTVYMVTYFIGGALGSFFGSYAWSLWHWGGVCTVGLIMVMLSLAAWALHFSTTTSA